MGKHPRYWIILLVLVGVALAVYFEPSHCVRGWIWGEAFFGGRPTSWWRGVVERDLRTEPPAWWMRGPVRAPDPTMWEWCKGWATERHYVSSFALFNSSDAEPVLQQLSEDENEKVAGFSKDVLDWDHLLDSSSRTSWNRLRRKHVLRDRHELPE
jgi:hypothetical protein